MPRRILCFGDSNTFGWIGRLDGPTLRFPSDIRWTGRLSTLLGPDFEIIEEGLDQIGHIFGNLGFFRFVDFHALANQFCGNQFGRYAVFFGEIFYGQ